MGKLKQVIVMRTDTAPPMRKGKMVAQGGHSVIAFLKRRFLEIQHGDRMPDQFMKYGDFDFWGFLGVTPEMAKWLMSEEEAMICLRADSEEELLSIHQAAKDAGLETHLITDKGLTEFDGPTRTCLSIGPDDSERIDKITGHLKLL